VWEEVRFPACTSIERQSTDSLFRTSSAIPTELPLPVSFIQVYSVKVFGLYLFKEFKGKRARYSSWFIRVMTGARFAAEAYARIPVSPLRPVSLRFPQVFSPGVTKNFPGVKRPEPEVVYSPPTCAV